VSSALVWVAISALVRDDVRSYLMQAARLFEGRHHGDIGVEDGSPFGWSGHAVLVVPLTDPHRVAQGCTIAGDQ